MLLWFFYVISMFNLQIIPPSHPILFSMYALVRCISTAKQTDSMMRNPITPWREILYFPIMFYRDSLSCWRSLGWLLVSIGVWAWPRFMFERRAHYSQHLPWSSMLLYADGSTWWEWFPHLRAELVGLHLGLLFEPVVSIVVSKGILNECCEHEHITDPEVDIQRLDGWRSRQGGAGAYHQRGHGENSRDPCAENAGTKYTLSFCGVFAVIKVQLLRAMSMAAGS